MNAAASSQQAGQRPDCQLWKPGVRSVIVATTSGGIDSSMASESKKVASNVRCASPSAMHHGQSASSRPSVSLKTGPA
jgi:hypothetical protein